MRFGMTNLHGESAVPSLMTAEQCTARGAPLRRGGVTCIRTEALDPVGVSFWPAPRITPYPVEDSAFLHQLP